MFKGITNYFKKKRANKDNVYIKLFKPSNKIGFTERLIKDCQDYNDKMYKNNNILEAPGEVSTECKRN